MITESAFLSLSHPRLYAAMFRAGIQKGLREGFKKIIVCPYEDFLFKSWLRNKPPGRWAERMGLPRRSLEKYYKEALTLDVDPHSLNSLVVFENKFQRRKLGNRFIWDGDWDTSVTSFQDSFRYQFMADIWENRGDLTKSRRYQEMMQMIASGRPYRSYHKGVYLDTEQKVYRFLEIYIVFMEQLESEGYKSELSPDPLGVALNRNGQMIKINKGLHRLAMAQVVGIKSIPVQIRAVHRVWWERNKNLDFESLVLDENFVAISSGKIN